MRTKSTVLLAVTALLWAGCQSPSRQSSRQANEKEEEILRPTEDPQLAPYRARFARVEELLLRWDNLRNNGRPVEAGAIASRLRNEIDPAFGDFERAAKGELGLHAQYLAASALGFSADPRATEVLTAIVAGHRDAKLVGNALIALSVRADPRTPGQVLLARIAPEQGTSVKRYAPLALANVLDARRAAGLPVDARFENQAISRLAPLAVGQDPATRLHVAKALGSLRDPGAIEPLAVLTKDPKMRVRWAAAASLERTGDPRGFPEVVRLLHEVAPDSKHVIRDILIDYAAKLQGRPLTPSEVSRLGTGARAWSGWFNQLRKSGRLRTPSPTPAPASFPKPTAPPPSTPPPGTAPPPPSPQPPATPNVLPPPQRR